MTRETTLFVSLAADLPGTPLGFGNAKRHIHSELLTIFHLFLTSEFPASTLF